MNFSISHMLKLFVRRTISFYNKENWIFAEGRTARVSRWLCGLLNENYFYFGLLYKSEIVPTCLIVSASLWMVSLFYFESCEIKWLINVLTSQSYLCVIFLLSLCMKNLMAICRILCANNTIYSLISIWTFVPGDS